MSSAENAISEAKVFFSVIILCRGINDYLKESIAAVLAQSRQDFEILLLPDQTISEVFPKTRIIFEKGLSPAEKRDLVLKYGRGEIFAFLDDDAFPRADWLKNALPYFNNPGVAAVCGPGVTPEEDSVFQKASGWVSSSLLGGGPVAPFRFLPKAEREVDDFPSMNLIVRRSDFEAVGGFDSSFWPGEDSKLCLDLTKKLGKKIIYSPEVLVFHHRRPLFRQHLKQNGQFGLHRGYFARILPENSRRLTYFIPSIFTLFLLSFPVSFFSSVFRLVYCSVVLLYLFILFLTALGVYLKEKNIKISLLVIPGIFLTHIWYGLKFLQGFFTKELKH